MVDVAQIRLFGKTVGSVSWSTQYGVARFEYDEDFVRSGIQPSPILMPATGRKHLSGFIYIYSVLMEMLFRRHGKI